MLPPIHVESPRQAVRDAAIAVDAGCEGVFLIDHGGGDRSLVPAQSERSDSLPRPRVGVNLLGVPPERAFRMLGKGVRGGRTDDAMIDERAIM